MKLASKMLQNFAYFWNTKIHIGFFIFHFMHRNRGLFTALSQKSLLMHNSLNHYICPITKATNQKPPTVVLLWIIRQVELDHCFFPTFVPIIFPVSCALKIFVGFTYLLWDKYSDLGDHASADFFVTRQSKIHGCGGTPKCGPHQCT